MHQVIEKKKLACRMRISYSAVRAITRVIRGEAGQRQEGALQALDLQLPLVQNLLDAGQARILSSDMQPILTAGSVQRRFPHNFTSVLQAEYAVKLRVHVESEAADTVLSRIPLSVATYAASGTLSWWVGRLQASCGPN